MRDSILNYNIAAKIFRDLDPLEVEVMTFLFLAELPVHRNKLLVDSRKDTLDKCLQALHSKGLVGKRIRMYSLTNNGNEFIRDLKNRIDEERRKIKDNH